MAYKFTSKDQWRVCGTLPTACKQLSFVKFFDARNLGKAHLKHHSWMDLLQVLEYMSRREDANAITLVKA